MLSSLSSQSGHFAARTGLYAGCPQRQRARPVPAVRGECNQLQNRPNQTGAIPNVVQNGNAR
jgi:hypothetical protein